jgi:hypothetical protein
MKGKKWLKMQGKITSNLVISILKQITYKQLVVKHIPHIKLVLNKNNNKNLHLN